MASPNQSRSNKKDQFWKTETMARACGVDLSAAIREGILTEADYALAVERCRRCPEPDLCRSWLKDAKPGSAPPEFCINRNLWQELVAE